MVHSSNLTTVLAQKLHPVIEIKHSKVYNNKKKYIYLPWIKMKAIKAKKVNIGKHQLKNSEKEMKTESVG